jgi:hypothetical protein
MLDIYANIITNKLRKYSIDKTGEQMDDTKEDPVVMDISL